MLTTPSDDHEHDVDKHQHENNIEKHNIIDDDEREQQHQVDDKDKEKPQQEQQQENNQAKDRNNDKNHVNNNMPLENDSSNIIHTIPDTSSVVNNIILNDDDNNNNHDLYRIALFYCYIRISNCTEMISFHHQTLSQSLSTITPIHGRIRISKEGINGILSGKYNDLYQYEQQLRIKLSNLSSIPPPQQQQQDSSCSSSNVDSNDHMTHNNNNTTNNNSNNNYELDVKYCLLRYDISIELQLFHNLIIQETKQVVNLVDADINYEDDDDNNKKNNRNKKGSSYSSRRSRQKQRQQQKIMKTTTTNQINQHQQHLEHNKDDEHHQEADNESSNIVHKDDDANTNDVSSPISQSNHHVIDIKDIFHKTLQREHDIKQQNCHHLSPYEWNQYIQQLSSSSSPNNNTTTTVTNNLKDDNSSIVCDIELEQQNNNNRIILLDCRNVYESNIGYMKGYDNDGSITTNNNNNSVVTTLCTNTRKFQELPEVLLNESDTLMNASHIFMYCTGGVRCERASTFLHTLLEEKMKLKQESEQQHKQTPSPLTTNDEKKNDNDSISITTTATNTTNATINIPKIYQLHGGIQRYIESDYNDLFYGKNFVFDPRRTDPIVGGGGSGGSRNNSNDGAKLTTTTTTTESSTTTHDVDDNDDTNDSGMIPNTSQTLFDNNIHNNIINMKTTTKSVIVGRCVVCDIEHDDYDNGYAPSMNYEARCYKCRILVLVCNDCRKKVQCWNDNNHNNNVNDDDNNKTTITMTTTTTILPKLYCGGIEPNHYCLHCPPVRAIT